MYCGAGPFCAVVFPHALCRCSLNRFHFVRVGAGGGGYTEEKQIIKDWKIKSALVSELFFVQVHTGSGNLEFKGRLLKRATMQLLQTTLSLT